MIGLFNDSFLPIMDGVNITVYNYAYWLHRAGFGVCVIAPESPQDDEVTVPFEVLRYPSIPVPGRKPYRYGLERLSPIFKNKLQKMEWTLVHAHSPFSTGRMARDLARSKEIPFVATFHSKYRQDFQKSIDIDLILDKIVKEIIGFYQGADEVWIPQQGVIETMREYGFKGDAVVMENGNDLAGRTDRDELRQAQRAALGVADDEKMLLFVGQIIEQKNIPLLIDALKEIADLPFKVYLVGEGYGVDAFKERVASHGLAKKVFFQGVEKDRDRLAAYYAAADLFLFPSTYDTSGLVVKEAAAMQTPSLLIEGSDAASQIVEGENGFLAEENAQSYGAALRRVLGDGACLKRAGVGASETLACSWESVVACVAERYQLLIDKNRAGR